MTLSELKEPFRLIYDNCDKDLKNKSSEELIDIINNKSYNHPEDENDIYGLLIFRSWRALINILYKQKNTSLSVEECYCIYLDALEYVIETTPWKNEDNSLYGDNSAFIKAMMQCTHSRKVNYVIAQHRQKRILNCNALSIDALNDDFKEGYFSRYHDSYSDTGKGSLHELIRELFNDGDYLYSFILDAVLNLDIFDTTHNLDYRKLRKYLRDINEAECANFSTSYNININEVNESLKSFQDLPTNKLTNEINRCMMMLKHNHTIKEVLNVK